MFKSNFTVLLVDDEYSARKLVADRINRIPGITVVESLGNGLEAKEYLKAHVVDIVFTDIKMPIYDGLQLASYIKNNIPSCPVAIISGYNEFEYARQAIQFEVKNYLLKPTSFQQIVEAVERCKKDVISYRESLLVKHFVDDELEKGIVSTFTKGEDANVWISKFRDLIGVGGFVVTIKPGNISVRDKLANSFIYKNILSDALPGNNVFRLVYTNERYDYLLIPTNNELVRSIDVIPEYFERIFENPVNFEVLFNFNTVDEFFELYSSLQKNDNNSLIASACKYMEENLEKQLTRDDVARYVWLSPSYFSRLFKQIVGVGYNTYLTDLRINKAKELIGQNIPVSKIADAVGFQDARYFSSVFQEKIGYTPSEYRKIIRDDKMTSNN